MTGPESNGGEAKLRCRKEDEGRTRGRRREDEERTRAGRGQDEGRTRGGRGTIAALVFVGWWAGRGTWGEPSLVTL